MRRKLGHKYEVAPGVWRLQVEHGRDERGRRKRKSSTYYGDDQGSELALVRLLLEVGKASPGSLTLSEFITEAYLPALTLRRNTIDGYEEKLRLHVLPALGHLRLDRLEPYMLDRWSASLEGTTGLHAYRVLHTALNRAVRWRLLDANPLRSIPAPTPNEYDAKVLAYDDAMRLVAHFRGHRLEPVVALAVGAGLRRCELAALLWTDVDFTEGTVSVTKGRHQRDGEVWESPPKSRTSTRVVPLPAWCMVVLRRTRALGPICGHLKPQTVADTYKRHYADSTLPWCPMMNLRHTYGTALLERGVDLLMVSRLMGHSTPAVTAKHYLRPSRDAFRKAVSALD